MEEIQEGKSMISEDLLYRVSVVILIIMFLCTAGFVSLLHCDVTYPHQRSQREVVITENPYTYVIGAVTDAVRVLPAGRELITQVTILPFGVDATMTQKLVFCGDQWEQMKDKGLIVGITYSKIRHRTYCNDLFSIDSIIPSSSLP